MNALNTDVSTAAVILIFLSCQNEVNFQVCHLVIKEKKKGGYHAYIKTQWGGKKRGSESELRELTCLSLWSSY